MNMMHCLVYTVFFLQKCHQNQTSFQPYIYIVYLISLSLNHLTNGSSLNTVTPIQISNGSIIHYLLCPSLKCQRVRSIVASSTYQMAKWSITTYDPSPLHTSQMVISSITSLKWREQGLVHVLPLSAKLHIYNSLILSHLNFCILVWGYKFDKIVKLQKKISRILSLSKYNAHTEPILKRLKLLKVSDILLMQKLKFYYKFIPEKLQNLPLYANTNPHNYATWTNKNVHLEFIPNHEYAKICVKYQILSIALL